MKSFFSPSPSSRASSPTICPSPSASSSITNTEEHDDFELAYKIILDDLQQLQLSRKGKSKEGTELTDEECAFEIMEEGLRLTLLSLSDQRVARSIDSAVVADADCIEAIVESESQAARDRQYALSLSRPATPYKSAGTDTSTRTSEAGPSHSKFAEPSVPIKNPYIVYSYVVL